jgi:transposase
MHVRIGNDLSYFECVSSLLDDGTLGRGYRVRLIAAQFVKPYVKSKKNDRVDAEAIFQAMSRPNMRFVAPKTVVQQDIQAAHRIREKLVGQRRSKANQIRGLMGEYGVWVPWAFSRSSPAARSWGSVGGLVTDRSYPASLEFENVRLY